MAKRLARPATIELRARLAPEPVLLTRKLAVPREGSGIEGLYSSLASHEELQLEGLSRQRDRAWQDGIRTWILMILFWGVVIWLVTAFGVR